MSIVRAPCRLAIRNEGEWVVAYLLLPGETPGGEGLEIGRLSCVVLDDDGGKQGQLFQGWKQLLSDWLIRTLEKITGLKVAGTTEESPPPNEKIQ